MPVSRRHFMTTAAVAGTITVLPFTLSAAGHMAHEFSTSAGPVTVHPVSHASVVLETPKGTIYIDPVGGVDLYENLPAASLVLVTHEHGDHFNSETLAALVGPETVLITNPAVHGKLADALKGRALSLRNCDSAEVLGGGVEAVPAYNLTAGRENFHPKGRDNGYVLTLDGFRVYVSGDTEDIPEMRALRNIDLAFVCMNLPFTMDAAQAASAVREFKPKFVYPYHYRGRGDGTQDPQHFANLVGPAAEVRFGAWY